MVNKQISDNKVILTGKYDNQIDRAYMVREEKTMMTKLMDSLEEKGHELHYDGDEVKCYNCNLKLVRDFELVNGNAVVTISIVGAHPGRECIGRDQYKSARNW